MSGATKAVAANSAIFPIVTAQIVAFERGVGGWISRLRTGWRVRLKPLEVESEYRGDLYVIVFSLKLRRVTFKSMDAYIERRVAT